MQNILRRADVEKVTGLRKTAIYKRVAEGSFPKPIKLTEKAVGWLESEVEAWQTARIASREQGAR
ncbi:AlpA family phage regulatory protein [Rhizobium rhizogenes]|uniref:helix-turn-helix transcriptional regulator n=1 Tax=Rhizobium rhizogenes TaxID=359 RepID=UPI0015731B7C|nr:AlpA family phage regulatory protein [Rhizobium rhizogenes]NTI22269.1 AlpA family phage regulatory protein [Rhizobium rhizogenes]QTG05861.1 AlpA family phage regulatory protein [Rhizobium rhizogenes]